MNCKFDFDGKGFFSSSVYFLVEILMEMIMNVLILETEIKTLQMYSVKILILLIALPPTLMTNKTIVKKRKLQNFTNLKFHGV